MVRPHKSAGRSITVVSSLPTDELISLCRDAADQCKVRLDQEKDGRLVFYVAGLVLPAKNRILTFEVQLGNKTDRQLMTSHIVSYRTSQPAILGLIPIGPRRMLGLPVYEKFMQRFGELVNHADSLATVTITG